MSRRYLLAAAVLSLTVSRVGLADPLVHTYSIVARDPATGEMGVAVQSHWFSVGSIVTWVEAGVGAARGGAACLRGGARRFAPRGRGSRTLAAGGALASLVRGLTLLVTAFRGTTAANAFTRNFSR